jgi:signal transduction histidine kinase
MSSNWSPIAIDTYMRVVQRINDYVDIYQVSKIMCEEIRKAFNAEGCELSILGIDKAFTRIYFDRVRPDSQGDSTESLGAQKSPLDHSLFGHCVKNKRPRTWIETPGEQFISLLDKTASVEIKKWGHEILSSFPGGIRNYIVVPLLMPQQSISHIHPFGVTACLGILNLHNASLVREKIIETENIAHQVISLLSIYIFNALFYARASDEIQIKTHLEKNLQQSNTVDEMLRGVLVHFANLMHSPISALWMNDEENGLLGLTYIHLESQYLSSSASETDSLESISKQFPSILNTKDSLLGRLVMGQSLSWIRMPWDEIPIQQRQKWLGIYDHLGLSYFVALAVRDNNRIIAVFMLNPSVEIHGFEHITLDYYRLYCDQLSAPLRFLAERTHGESLLQLAEKIKMLINKNPQSFYNEVVYKVKEVINAEACSLFEVRTNQGPASGIYLTASSDKTAYTRQLIGKKIYELDRTSIIGTVAVMKQPIAVFDVTKVSQFYPNITSRGRKYEETIASGTHRSFIGVPIDMPFSDKDAAGKNFMVIRCINKITHTKESGLCTPAFSDYDKRLLDQLGAVLMAYRKLFNALKERDNLIQLVIHEANNPIISIRHKIDSLLRIQSRNIVLDREILKNKYEDITVMASLALAWVNNTSLLNDLLQGKKIEAQPKTMKLRKELENVIYWLRPELEKSGLKPQQIISDMKIDENIMIRMDHKHLVQTIYNLIVNAIKYRKIESPLLIMISGERRNGDYAITIQDWGVGIDEIDLNGLFTRGYRSEYAIQNNVKGLGFGLWLCKKLLLSNSIELLLEQNRDPTKFTIIVPSKLVYNR